jgi:Protein of unknown function (DUF1571)
MRHLAAAFVILTLLTLPLAAQGPESQESSRLDEVAQEAVEIGEAIGEGAQQLAEQAQDLGQDIAEAVETQVDEISGEAATPEEAVAEPELSGREETLLVLNSIREGITERMTGGYSGHLISEELIDGEMYRKDLDVWFRLRPRSLRIEFRSPDEGQVVTWQESWDSMSVDRPWLPALSIDPAGERALATSHRPVTTFGIDLTIDRYIAAIERTPEDAEVTCENLGLEQAGRQNLTRLDFSHPEVPGNPVTSFTIWLDPETLLPIHFENRRADGSRYERYRYIEFRLNPPLDGDLFDD